jgi:cell division protein ZapE
VTSESDSVAAHLLREVAGQQLEFDPAQQDAAVALDRLRDALRRRPRSFGPWQRAGFRWFPRHAAIEPQRGLYLWGGVGRGKTLLMDAFFATLQKSETQAERWHFYRFMQQVHAELRDVHNRARPLDVIAHRMAKRARVICLDEFIVSDIGDAMILAALFEGLFRRGVTLVATSNLPPRDLYKDGLQRQRFLPAIDLIETHVDVLHLDGGTDYRLRRLEQAPTYLDSALPGTTAELSQLFDRLAAGMPAPAARISIAGRTIAAKRAGAGLAWFEFRDLCEGARSQNDYIEIAHLYHTIFVSNVPLLGKEQDDAARRFVMLIDELYDRGVKLVVSAAAAPAALYRGERLQFEFQRAASRLIEMQTQRYLSREHRP